MSDPIVTIRAGKIQGRIDEAANDQKFYSFQGIPYAKPPLGPLRFKAPQPPEPWTGIRDATKEGNDCFQTYPRFSDVPKGNEDCLYLNVYTPKLPEVGTEGDLKPVMVWIHGGSFTNGSGSTELFGPEFLLTEDVVLVTINYRLCILGFFNLEDPNLDVPGNAGLKDIVLALKWVQENIRNFSGDCDNVTIFGESAGAVAVHYLILSSMAKGLFSKAILQSGCAINLWAKGRNYSSELAQLLGIQTNDEREILKVLQEMPLEELYSAVGKIPDRFLANEIRPHGVVVEKKHEGAFLSEDPWEIIKSGKYNKVPVMIGYTTGEGMVSEVLQKPDPFEPLTDFELAVPHFLQLQPKSDVSKLTGLKIKEFYYGNEEPSTDNKDKYYLLNGDNLFIREILLSVKYHIEASPAPVFLYRMSIESELNFVKKIYGIQEPGVCHGDDIGYLFKNSLTPEIKEKSDEDIALRRFVALWTNFAKFGDPNPKKENPLINVEWKPVTHNELSFLDIGKELTLGTDPESERMAFWENLFQDLGHDL